MDRTPLPPEEVLVWLDLETTGLNERRGTILELGAILTNNKLEELSAWSSVVHPTSYWLDLSHWDPSVVAMHGKTGLLAECLVCEHDIVKVGNNFTLWLTQELHQSTAAPESWRGELTAAGFSVHFDLRWLRQHLPNLQQIFSHRVLDVSSLKILARRWWGDAAGKVLEPPASDDYGQEHRALADCRAAIACLRRIRDAGWAHTPDMER